MRVDVETKALRDALGFASLATSRDADILQAVHISATDVLELRCCSRDIEARARVDAAITERGETAVDAIDLARILSCGSDVTRLSGSMDIVSGGLKASLPDFPVTSFPTLNGNAEFTEIEGGCEALIDLERSCSTEEAKWTLRGVCFAPDGATASTGFSGAHIPGVSASGQIVPVQVCGIVRKMKNPRLFVSDSLWRAEADGQRVWGRLIDANYPVNWSANFKPGLALFKCNAAEFADMIKAVTLGRADLVHIRTEAGRVVLTGDRFRHAHMDIEITGPEAVCDFSIVADTRGLLGMFEALEGDVTVMGDGHQFQIMNERGQAVIMGTRDARTNMPEPA